MTHLKSIITLVIVTKGLYHCDNLGREGNEGGETEEEGENIHI